MLHHFHQLIELQESQQIFSEIDKNPRNLPLPDIKSNLHTWRERLPNSWESASYWSGIVSWRSFVFQRMLKSLDQQGQLLFLSFSDAIPNFLLLCSCV